MSIIKGGSARFNGVIFYSENFSSKASRNKDGTIHIDISERKVAPKFERVIHKIPFIRGLFLLARPIFYMWKIYVFVFFALFVLRFLLAQNSKHSIDTSFYLLQHLLQHFLLLFVIVVFIFGIVCKISNLGKYHAAEHMTDTSYSELSSLNLADVNKQSRIHHSCGTNFVVHLLVTYCILSFFIADFIVLMLLSVCIAYELFLLPQKYLAPIYWLGGIFQYTLFTSKPSTSHLEVAIASYEALLAAEKQSAS